MLTPRQQEVLAVFRRYRSEHGVSPTLRELAEELGLSKGGAQEHVDALIEKGQLVRRAQNKSRSIEPVGEELIAREDAVIAVDKVVSRKKGSDQDLGAALKSAIQKIPSRTTIVTPGRRRKSG